MNYAGQVKSGTVWLTVSFAVTGICGIAIHKLLTHFFSLEEYGVYSIVMAIAGFSILVFGLGIPDTIQRYVPQYLAQNEHRNLKRFLARNILVFHSLAIAPLALLVWQRDRLATLFNLPPLPEAFYVLAGLLVFLHLALFLESCLLVSFAAFRARTLGEIIGYGGRIIAIVAVGLSAPDIKFLLAGLILVSLLHFLYNGSVLAAEIRRLAATLHEKAVNTAEIAKFAFARYFHSLFETILDFTFDIYMISWLLGAQGPAQAGIYALGITFLNIVLQVNPCRIGFAAIRNAVLRRYDSRLEMEPTLVMVRLYAKLLAFFYIPIIIGTAFLARPFFSLFFPPEYLRAADVFVLGTVFMGTALSFVLPFGLITDILKLKRVHIYSRVFVLYNVALNYILIPEYGIYGAIVSTGSAWLLIAVFLYLYIRRLAPLNLDWSALARSVANGLPMAAALYLLSGFTDAYWKLAIDAALGCAVFFAAARVNRILSDEERTLVSAGLPRRWIFF